MMGHVSNMMPKSGVLKRLDFDRYTIDLPEETSQLPFVVKSR